MEGSLSVSVELSARGPMFIEAIALLRDSMSASEGGRCLFVLLVPSSGTAAGTFAGPGRASDAGACVGADPGAGAGTVTGTAI